MAEKTKTKTASSEQPTSSWSDVIGNLPADLAGILHSEVSDLTSPQVQQIVSDIVKDGLLCASYKATENADPEVLKMMQDGVRARAIAASRLAGLITAANTPSFVSILNTLLTSVIGIGFTALRAYSGGLLSSIPATGSTTPTSTLPDLPPTP